MEKVAASAYYLRTNKLELDKCVKCLVRYDPSIEKK